MPPEREELQGASVLPPGAGAPYLLVSCGQDLYGIPLARMREIVDARHVFAVSGAPQAVVGRVTTLGHSIWVLDLPTRFGIATGQQRSERCVLIVNVAVSKGPSVLGLMVDGAEFLVELNPNAIQPLPLLGRPSVPCLSGIAEHEGRLILLVHVDSLLVAEEWARLMDPSEMEQASAEAIV